MAREYRRGQVYYANLDPIVGHEQAGYRPVLIIQNDTGNTFSPTVIVAALTTTLPPRPYPTEVRISAGTAGLEQNSSIRLDQIRTMDKRRLERYVGQLDAAIMRQVDEAIKISLGLLPL
ncbi:MAG: PemK family transcriptional regulator [Chloroflexi bacterium HGW-Chloroflexi-1]|nr:MAG: PemK family transcriptional regulator [Chloroflexi bacterium HGW-Chloroflexi-1]